MEKQILPNYKNLPLEKLFAELRANTAGLTDKEAEKRSAVYGLNELTRKKKISAVAKFFSYFKNPLILILIVAALISGMTGEKNNFIIITSMIFLSISLNFYQEYKSGRAAEKIAKKLAVRASVLRNGKQEEILVKHIVPGDVICLSAGDIVPADGRIIKADDFFVNESALTGESFPAEKTAVGDKNTVFSGTNVVSGYAQILATTTGVNTEYGKIADKIIAPAEINAFEIGIKNFGYLIIKVIIAIVLAIFLINAFYKKDFIDSFIFSLAIAVGITPELLPVIMSVNMARGSIKMAKGGVIVKRLNAIPDFGSMDILCADKTGTLTENKIVLVRHLDVFGRDSDEVLRLAFINGFFETGIKSILDAAILEFKKIELKNIKKIDEIPYDFVRRRSSIVYEENKNRQMITKGAPEEIFKICSFYMAGGQKNKITKTSLKKFSFLYDELSKQGFRVLAVAAKDVEDGKEIYPIGEEAKMTLAGFLAFFDPPKESAKETLAFMANHGIEIKILTGDSPLVTKKICADLGLKIKGVISGEDLDINEMDDAALAVKAASATIFARLSPSQKEKIVSALRKSGQVVGYLGDGINDAPALKSANVGISVDNAVDVAKETADIILMKKGLKELMDGVIEGRKTFGNTMKYMMMGLSSNFGNMFSMIGATLYLPFFPLLPGQILLNNFLYDVSQITLPADNVDKEYLKKPKHWDIKFIKKFMFVFGPISSLFDFATFYLLYSFFHLSESHFQTGWFIESLATQILVIYIIRTRQLPFIKSRPSKYLVFSTIGAILVGIIITMPFMDHFFGFSSLPLPILLAIFALVIIYLFLVEIIKRFFYKRIEKTLSNADNKNLFSAAQN